MSPVIQIQIHPHTTPDQHRTALLMLIRKKFPRGGIMRYTVWTPNGQGDIYAIGGVDDYGDIDQFLFMPRQSGWAFVYHRETNEIEYYLRN